VRSIPASSEKAISEATACKEDLEKQKVKEEEKLKEVMESLKEETSGLQQDKEVCLCFVIDLTVLSTLFLLNQVSSCSPIIFLLLHPPEKREGANGTQQGRK